MSERTRSKADLLSREMKVAAEIYRFNSEGEKIWFTKLAESLRGVMAASTIQKALNALIDWGIVRVQYGETDTGRAGRLLMIAGEAEETISLVYKQYWKERRELKRSS